MENWVYFLIRASVYLLVFYLVYVFFLKEKGSIRFTRLYVLISLIFSVTLGAIGRISLSAGVSGAGNELSVLLPEVMITASNDVSVLTQQLGDKVSALAVLYPLFAGIVAFILFRLGLQVLTIFLLIRKHPVEQRSNVKIVTLPADQPPFSFFHWIFIPESAIKSDHLDKIIRHEQAHVRFGHSWDMMFFELVQLVFWFHPVFYFFRMELKVLHEYEADNHTLMVYRKTDYQRALLEFATGGSFIPIINPFNVSTLKKRFMMMNKKRNQSMKKLLPALVALMMMLGSVFFIHSCNVEPDHTQETELYVPETESQTEPEVAEFDTVFNIVEKQPVFPGGMDAFMSFLQENLQYPQLGIDAGVEGTVFITFVVARDGEIANARVLRNIGAEQTEIDSQSFREIEQKWDDYDHDLLLPTTQDDLHAMINEIFNREALRVINLMPDWEPGTQKGENVNVQFNVPITFVLN
jgi:hypothetical protein